MYHYASKGTVAPYNENGDNTFDRNDNEVLTLPVSMNYSEGSDFDTNENICSNPLTQVIILPM